MSALVRQLLRDFFAQLVSASDRRLVAAHKRLERGRKFCKFTASFRERFVVKIFTNRRLFVLCCT